MLTYIYIARDKEGNEVKGELQADTEQAAARLITKQGLSPIDIKIKGQGFSILGGARGTKVRAKDRILFTRQLATLINAGLPLTQSLRSVAGQTSSKGLVQVINQVIAAVEGGSSFASALEKHPNVFNEVYVSLIAAGESSGTLDEALERIAGQQEKDAEMLSKVRGALVYPVIVLVVIVGVVIFMLTTVLPQIEVLYRDLQRELPFFTNILLILSRFITRFWYLVAFASAIGVVMYSRWSKTPPGKSFNHRIRMNVPIFGKMFMKLYMARFTRTGQTLLSTGVPMLETLRITAKSTNNVHIEAATLKAAEKVKGGKALSDALSGNENFLPLVPQMIRIGEQSGAIDSMLGKIADYYEKELDAQIKAISSSIEPVLMVVLAAVAALMVAAVLLPVYGLVGENLNL